MTPSEIAELRRLTRTVLAASEARMADLRRQEAEIVSKIIALDAALRQRASSATVEDCTLRAGVDLRWKAWVEQRRRHLVSAQARLRARIEEERVALQRDFGRDMVMDHLAREATAGGLSRSRRRAERDG